MIRLTSALSSVKISPLRFFKYAGKIIASKSIPHSSSLEIDCLKYFFKTDTYSAKLNYNFHTTTSAPVSITIGVKKFF